MVAAEINILSAGAVAPGLKIIGEHFERKTGQRVELTFATAPAILERVNTNAAVDIVIAPTVVLEDLTRSGKISNRRRVRLGRIGVGAMVRTGAPEPRIATADQLKESLQEAKSVVFNRASTGSYLEKLFRGLGIGMEVEAKSIRYPDFAAVLDHISRGGNGEIGFGATTVIIENVQRGVTFVGALSAEIQNYTAYEAAVVQYRAAGPAPREFIEYLESTPARSALAQAGIL